MFAIKLHWRVAVSTAALAAALAMPAVCCQSPLQALLSSGLRGNADSAALQAVPPCHRQAPLGSHRGWAQELPHCNGLCCRTVWLLESAKGPANALTIQVSEAQVALAQLPNQMGWIGSRLLAGSPAPPPNRLFLKNLRLLV